MFLHYRNDLDGVKITLLIQLAFSSISDLTSKIDLLVQQEEAFDKVQFASENSQDDRQIMNILFDIQNAAVMGLVQLDLAVMGMENVFAKLGIKARNVMNVILDIFDQVDCVQVRYNFINSYDI